MERYFIIDKFNSFYDWRAVLTDKNIPDAELNTNLVKVDGRSGSLDLTEALTGEVTYNDRTITAKFWTDAGNRRERESLLRSIRLALHGKKVKIIEPDDPAHYFYGRIKVKDEKNILPYATFTIEATCEPWRYALEETVRKVRVTGGNPADVVINNNGVKTLTPRLTIEGKVKLRYNDIEVSLSQGSYIVSDLKLKQGFNIIGVTGSGSVTFTYREAEV